MSLKKINRIFLFGDSWVEGQGIYDHIDEYGNFLELHDYKSNPSELRIWRRENSWVKYIKNHTSSHVINNGIQASNNYTQFDQLNSIVNDLTDTDLVLFGFTSKLRDRQSTRYSFDYQNSLLHTKNPILSQMAWERISLEECNFGLTEENKDSNDFNDEIELNFTKNFIQEYFLSIYDDYPFEYTAQVNYLFYQERFKSLGLNLICFDLFEPYVNPKYVKDTYNVNTDVYINYNGKTMNEVLIDYEIKNIKEDEISLWEIGHKRPDLVNKIYHPNQHGYKIYVDYLFTEVLPTMYDFKKKSFI
tara:strand:- start:529 stop:1437 length:909 start_codon:yes stop_codon:yes gene_type:complete